MKHINKIKNSHIDSTIFYKKIYDMSINNKKNQNKLQGIPIQISLHCGY